VVSTAAGNITVKLKRIEKGQIETGLQIEAVVPDNTLAKIYVPVRKSEQFAVYANDKKIWEDGSFVGGNNNILYNSQISDSILFNIQPGTYIIYAVDDDSFTLPE